MCSKDICYDVEFEFEEEPLKITNFKKLKNMNIEDFTAWLSNLADCSNCTIRKCDGLCYEAWLKWLKSEAEKND